MRPKMRRILFTGGGTAGHITPNIPLIKEFKKLGWEVHCGILGNNIEIRLLKPLGIKLHEISAGKLRRYFDLKNFVDFLMVLKGILESVIYLRKLKPNVIFSKGGYIALPITIGAWFNRIPVIIHESDTIPSLTTKLIYPFTGFVCVGFPIVNKSRWRILGIDMKTVYTGIPIRGEFLKIEKNRKERNRYKRMNLLVLGGSLGANSINVCIRGSLKLLTQDFNIIHVCGETKVDSKFKKVAHYKQYTFLHKGIEKLIGKSDIVVTRGGATFLYELLLAKKPSLIIPLSRKVSRGDQISNAKFFKKENYGDYIFEEDLNPKNLVKKLLSIKKGIKIINNNLERVTLPNSTELIKDIILNKAI